MRWSAIKRVFLESLQDVCGGVGSLSKCEATSPLILMLLLLIQEYYSNLSKRLLATFSEECPREPDSGASQRGKAYPWGLGG